MWQRRLGGFSRAAAFPEWVKLLKSLSGYEAYLREFRAALRPDRVLQFLLQAEHFPRSLLHCMQVAESQLVAVATEGYGRSSTRMAGRLVAELRFADPDEYASGDLNGALDRFEANLVELPVAVENDFFRPRVDVALHSYRAY